jgi:multidrug efflux pump subunit AcrB
MRFKPVMSTSLTDTAGLLPLAIWGGSLWGPLAVVLVFGLTISTFWVLVMWPVMYAMMVRPKEGKRAIRFWSQFFARFHRA